MTDHKPGDRVRIGFGIPAFSGKAGMVVRVVNSPDSLQDLCLVQIDNEEANTVTSFRHHELEPEVNLPDFANQAALHLKRPELRVVVTRVARTHSDYDINCYGCGWTTTTGVEGDARTEAQVHANSCTGLGVDE